MHKPELEEQVLQKSNKQRQESGDAAGAWTGMDGFPDRGNTRHTRGGTGMGYTRGGIDCVILRS